MTTSSYQTDIQTMVTAAQRVADVAVAVQTDMRRLDSNIQTAMAGWRGGAANAYVGLHQRWMDSSGRLTRVLHEIAEGLVQNANRYQAAEDAATQNLVRTASTLA